MGLRKTAQKFKELGPKGFMKQWGKGVQGITPLQQTITTLWSFLPVISGLVWGITITLLGRTYWLSLVLVGSLPITLVQVIANYQKYVRLKEIKKQMEMLEEDKK